MPKTKTKFSAKKISKRKKALPVSFFQKVKRLVNSLSFRRRFGVLALAILGVGILNHYQGGLNYFFKADLLQTPAPFNGTVFPVEKVPNWTKWKGNNATDAYSSIDPSMLIPLPDYDLVKMQKPDADLKWGNAADDEIRNMKITYPVVYLGNYKLDHMENSGSHLAVDMKMPVGTPVRSIANGRVTVVSMDAGGFGHHVVIEHKNVPSASDPSKKVTLYVAFNHMDQINVIQGQIVSKGDVIGTSGNTGTSTTPHLHFQIDTDSAPWHPYWPFTNAEAQQAGLSFFEAVDAGLGLANAQKNTISPLVYVKKYLNYSASDSNQTPPPEANPTPTPQAPPQDIPEADGPPVPTPEPVNLNGLDTSLFDFTLTAEKASLINNQVAVKAVGNATELSKMSATDEVEVSIAGEGQTSKKYFKAADFKDNAVTFYINSAVAGTLTVEMGKASVSVNFIEKVNPIAALKIEGKESFQFNVPHELKIIAVDDAGNPTPVANFPGAITFTAKEGEATFNPPTISANDFKNGVATVQMTVANSKRVLIRAQQGVIIGESDSFYASGAVTFKDLPATHPNYQAIKALQEEGVISGYSDGTFRPDEVVVRVEALKMLMLAFDVKTDSSQELPFTDTDEKAWYAKTLATAFHKEIVKGYADGTFQPGKTVNVAEFLKMLFETNGIEPNETLKANPYEDVPVSEWYAGYAYLTNKKNLMEVRNNRLQADKGMTRKDVAEAIYRLQYILEKNQVSYAN